MGSGQFCTNPGLVIAVKGDGLNTFMKTLETEILKTIPAKMLHPGIAKSYFDKRSAALSQKGIMVVASVPEPEDKLCGNATIVTTDAKNFLANPLLHQEVFGPYSLIVQCENVDEMTQVAEAMEGQLTSTLMASAEDLREHDRLVQSIKKTCGRLILNGVPTGVEVCLSMHHGGPYPATTDPRFTSVGADGIKRFARPITFQNWRNEFLPDELKNENPLNIYRTVNGELTKAVI
jgi:NADP-dependent aldehyde dehydrogenase